MQNKEKYATSLSPDFKIIIIGGKQIYEMYFPLCEAVWVTRIKKDYKCDLFVDYDFENQFKDYEIVKDDDELVILKYFKL
jgi:dihydrofolate reductase